MLFSQNLLDTSFCLIVVDSFSLIFFFFLQVSGEIVLPKSWFVKIVTVRFASPAKRMLTCLLPSAGPVGYF